MLILKIFIQPQLISLYENEICLKTYPVSTAEKGLGETMGSEKTPRGWHVIRAKIGGGYPLNTIFVGRRTTGDIATPDYILANPNKDFILTRILWLSGLERGKNRLGSVDTMRRYIYIHGTADEASVGTPKSKGCIRMRNLDIIDLFDHVPVGTRVFIQM